MASKETQESAYATALLRSLHFSGVQFLRYFTVDVNNNVRCKVKPVDHLLKNANATTTTLDSQASVAEVCFAGLPYYSDFMIDGTGMNARNVLKIQPDLGSFRILPYAPKSALVMGNLLDQYSDEPSPLCTRGLLSRVVQEAAEKHNIAFVSSMTSHVA
jgi:glutamine synthetase